MPSVVWSDVADASSTWDEQSGYVFIDYVVDGYVIGDLTSGSTWSPTVGSSVVWS